MIHYITPCMTIHQTTSKGKTMEDYLKGIGYGNFESIAYGEPITLTTEQSAIAPITTNPQQQWSFDTAFEGGNLGTTLGGIGTGVNLIAGLYNAHEDKKMKEKLYANEQKRVERAEAKEDKFHDDMSKAWG